MPSLLVRDGTVLTADPRRRIVRGDVHAEDGVIRAVGDGCPRDADVVVDASGSLVIPGLVNLHAHAAMTLLRGAAEDLPLERWLEERVWPIEARLREADVLAGFELAAAEMLAGGVTSFNDMYFFADSSARVAERIGVRAWIGAVFLDFETPDAKPEEMSARAKALVARWRDHALVTPTLAPHATYTCGDATLEAVRELRRDTGAQVHVHCSETRDEVYRVQASRGDRPVAVLARHGLLDGSVLAHCGWITKEEARTIGRAGASVAHCPASNMKLGTGGTTPIPELHEAGAAVGIGTDGAASNNVLDVFQGMKLAALVQKQHRWDAGALPAARVLDMATRDGARALGRGDLGVVAAGARADLAIVDASRPHMAPLLDPESQIVHAARAGDVTHTIVDGRVLYERGEFRTLDGPRVVAEARLRAERVARR